MNLIYLFESQINSIEVKVLELEVLMRKIKPTSKGALSLY